MTKGKGWLAVFNSDGEALNVTYIRLAGLGNDKPARSRWWRSRVRKRDHNRCEVSGIQLSWTVSALVGTTEISRRRNRVSITGVS